MPPTAFPAGCADSRARWRRGSGAACAWRRARCCGSGKPTGCETRPRCRHTRASGACRSLTRARDSVKRNACGLPRLGMAALTANLRAVASDGPAGRAPPRPPRPAKAPNGATLTVVDDRQAACASRHRRPAHRPAVLPGAQGMGSNRRTDLPQQAPSGPTPRAATAASPRSATASVCSTSWPTNSGRRAFGIWAPRA